MAQRRVRRLRKRLRVAEKRLWRAVRTRRARPASPAKLVARAERAVDEVARTGRPVIAGPWLGEVGFELLYWIPFLRWAVERRPELAARLHIVTRGGAGIWYGDIADRHVDVYALLAPEEVARRRGKRTKQVERTELEDDLLERAARESGLDRWSVLHPSAMYQALTGFAVLDATPAFRRIAAYRRLPPPGAGPLAAGLPDDYVAVRFYFSAPFPDTAENRAFAAEFVRTLAADTTVVLLNTGLRLDDHRDAGAVASERVVTIEGHLEPATNLAVQSDVIAGARAYVGTYGGLSYLPAFYGVPSLAFHSHGDQFLRRHLELAHGVFAELGTAYVTLPTSAAEVLALMSAPRPVTP